MDLNLERHPYPWILSWTGQGEANGFGFGSGFAISVQTRSIAILMMRVCLAVPSASLDPLFSLSRLVIRRKKKEEKYVERLLYGVTWFEY
jgi:hypothetical protein